MGGEYTADVVHEGSRRLPRQDAPGGPRHHYRRGQGAGRANRRLQGARRPTWSARRSPAAIRRSAPAVRSVRCSPRSSWSNASSGRRTCPATSAATAFGMYAPFNLGNTCVGYGLGLASSTGIAPNFGKRTISIMGDGGFWHNGLTTGVASATYNNADSVLIVMKNGYTSATGWQFLPSSAQRRDGLVAQDQSVENSVARRRRQMDAHRRQLQGRQGRQGAARGADHGGEGPQGHHRRRRVHAGQAAPRARRGRQEHRRRPPRRQAEIRHRRSGLHRRSLLHPPVGLPVARRSRKIPIRCAAIRSRP